MQPRLYYTGQYPGSWVSQTAEGAWVMFPAKLDGWDERQPASGIDSIRLREVPINQGFNTGMPGTSYSEMGLAVKLQRQAHPPPPPAKAARSALAAAHRRKAPPRPPTVEPSTAPARPLNAASGNTS